MEQTLVLSASYGPLRVISWQKAMLFEQQTPPGTGPEATVAR